MDFFYFLNLISMRDYCIMAVLHIHFLILAVGGRTKLGHGLLSGKYSIPVTEV